MALIQQFTPKYIATATTTVVVTSGNTILHTVVCPIALTGTATFQSTESSPTTYFVLPIGSIGSFQFDSTFPLGLGVVTSAADKLIVTTQTP